MVAGLYDALKSAGASEDLARRAAEEVANYEAQLADIRSDLKLLKWMVGFTLGICVAIAFNLYGG